jgi:hypothetical protein
MAKLCKHQPHKEINDIWEPRYHDDKILINVAKVSEDIEHYIIKFKKCNKYPDWFYMSGKNIRRCSKQENGKGEVYVVPMTNRQAFEPDKNCHCGNLELFD